MYAKLKQDIILAEKYDGWNVPTWAEGRRLGARFYVSHNKRVDKGDYILKIGNKTTCLKSSTFKELFSIYENFGGEE